MEWTQQKAYTVGVQYWPWWWWERWSWFPHWSLPQLPPQTYNLQRSHTGTRWHWPEHKHPELGCPSQTQAPWPHTLLPPASHGGEGWRECLKRGRRNREWVWETKEDIPHYPHPHDSFFLTVDLNSGPVGQLVIRYVKGEGCGMWREIFIHSCQDQTRTCRVCILTDSSAQREELRGEVIGLL